MAVSLGAKFPAGGRRWAQLVLTGCSTPDRLPAVPSRRWPRRARRWVRSASSYLAVTQDMMAEAHSALAKEQQWRASQGAGVELPPAAFPRHLGRRRQWRIRRRLPQGLDGSGTRPEFKVVTGVSTGALIAPFAFVGPKYDYVLEKVYTTTAQKDIFKKRGLKRCCFGDAMADTRPLAKIISTYVNRQFLDEIAAEYAKGRLLLVGTTNLDSLEPVIWNMTAIAASQDPRAVPLFRSILLASASIPGAFPPVMIDVNLDGAKYQEMHVDGGTIAQVFLYPPSVSVPARRSASGRLTSFAMRGSTPTGRAPSAAP